MELEQALNLLDQEHQIQFFLETAHVPGISLHEHSFSKYIEPILEEMNFQVEYDNAGEKLGGNSGNLIAYWPGTDPEAEPVLFSAHMVNPTSDREYTIKDVRPAKVPKKVLVVGGGPAGMEAAICLADRGHQVILAEKNDHLGGTINFAKYVSFKADLDKFMNVLIRRVSSRKITVMLNTTMTPELARSLEPDAIIMAIGAKPIVPPIPGVDSEN